jgi:cyclin A
MLLQPMQHLQQAAVVAACPFSSAAGAKKTENNMQLQFYADPCEPDIDADLRAKERDPREHPDAQYMSTTQKGHISPSIRAELVLWMDAFARHLGDLPQGTLCRAVAYLDRVLTVRPVPSHDEALRLVAAAAVSLAVKYEQTSSERRLDADAEVVEEFVGTTVAAVEAMERELVMDLDCVMDGPTAFTFVERFTRFFKRKDEFLVRTLALRLVDLTLPEFRFVGKILPSAVAASALFLARQILAVPLSNKV